MTRRRSDLNLYNLDYRELGNSGTRIHKPSELAVIAMDVKHLKIKELQISDDLEESFSLYNLEDLVNHSELTEGLDSIGSLGRQFRHVHIELKDALDEPTYEMEYSEKYATTLTDVRTYQKDARQRIRDLGAAKPGNEVPAVEEDRDESYISTRSDDKEGEEAARVRTSITIEEQVFQEKLMSEIEVFDTASRSSVEKSCARFEFLLDEYYNLLGRAKIAFNDRFDDECKELFDKTLSQIRGQIKLGKTRVVELAAQEKEELDKVERERNRVAHENLAREQLAVAKVLSDEIGVRSKAITAKCDHSKLGGFDDHKILECLKNLPGIDIEVREILDKFTEFSKITALYR